MGAQKGFPFFLTKDNAMEDNTVTAVLTKPIKVGDKEITEVVLREPTMAALAGLEIQPLIAGNVTQLAALLPKISDLSKEQVLGLNYAQVATLSMYLNHFLVP